MGTSKALIMTGLILVMAAPAIWAGGHLPEERGQKLFQDQNAFGGEMSCSACHPDGRGLEQAGGKTGFRVMGQNLNTLEEAINLCIVNANKGKAIAVDSAAMQDLVAYIKSLAPKTPAAPGYGAPPRGTSPGYGAPRPAPGYGR
ncbi:c-type cytochrome [Desulfurivibrio sp. D14AmB]|uniref:c-type cytochrome n=1 Tax=Desulfurivibrio sp. D14AmB TaxID=3374370 RepID=UPI00376F3C6A